MAELIIDDVHVYLGDSYVVQGAALTIEEGRAVAVLGRNGVGKTTLLRAIMGLTEPPRRGTIRRGETDITRAPAWQRTGLGIGYVPQGRRIFASLTVEENLLVARRPAVAGVEAWTLERLFELFPNLKERRHQRGPSLSGGEQQMLAIARALISNPRLILLDEPTEGLAPIIVQRILDVLREVRGQGLAMLLVEQNFRFAGALADEVNVMQAGRFVHRSHDMSLDAMTAIAERYLGVAAADA